MIDTLYMANFLQNKINENTKGLKFLIFADEGDLKQSTKKRNVVEEYTHGILQIVSDNIVPFENLQFQTINTQLMLFVDLASEGFENITDNDGIKRLQSIRLIKVKECVNDLLEELNGKSTYINIEDRRFNLTITMGNPTDGTKTSLGEINDGFPLYLSIQFTVFENGVNSNYCKVLINGESIGYVQVVKSYLTQSDQGQFANIGSKGYPLIGTFSYDFTTPLLEVGVTQKIIDHIMGEVRTDNAYCVSFEYPNKEFNKICFLAKAQETDVAGLNVGLNISFVDGFEDVLNYGDEWETQTTSASSISLIIARIGDIVFWGDGTSTIIKTLEDRSHIYPNESEKIIKIFRKQS